MKNKIIICALLISPTVFSATVKGFDANVYGFMKASTNAASGALGSFNNINMSAHTHAAAQTRASDNTSRFGFQTQQSRIGTLLSKQNVVGHLEFDFVDFNKSSPTTQMVPRVRIAAITYSWENNKVLLGQDWDLFGPTNSYTFNYVGNYFFAGNTGFMRQQVQYLRTEGDYELGAAIGLRTSNASVSDNDTELSKAPSYSVRLTKKLEKGRIGLSGIYAHLKYLTGKQLSHDSYGANAFYEKDFSSISLKGEAYYGQNMFNIGTLAIGRGTASRDVKEFGGFLSANVKVSEKGIIFGGTGISKVLNRSEITPFAPQGAALDSSAITMNGLRQNFATKVGYEHRITEDFSFLTEISRYETDTKLSDNDYKTKTIGVLESGVQLRF